MDNTVGSCETKYWQKGWIPIKESLVLTKKQRTLIIGSLLGDGTMRVGKGAVNANYKVEHGLEQKEYVEWKYQILKPWVFTKPKISYRYNEKGERYAKSWWFRTVRHPILTDLYDRFYQKGDYRTGKKIIPKNLKKDFNPLALAVWIMDDGSYSRKNITISTYAFSLQEIKYLQDCLWNVFRVEARYCPDRDKGYRMYFNQEETRNLVKIISPYIIPTMMYKIGFATP